MKWHKYPDEKPPKPDTYWVTLDDNTMGEIWWMGTYWENYTDKPICVLAWQEIIVPEPYEED